MSNQPAWQDATAHIPALHIPAATCGVRLAQLLPQVPQWASVLERLVSQPLATLLSQSPKPLLQETWHSEFTHDGVSLLVEQAMPQPPQFLVSLVELTSHPSANSPLQSR